jgi:hypothetical protein
VRTLRARDPAGLALFGRATRASRRLPLVEVVAAMTRADEAPGEIRVAPDGLLARLLKVRAQVGSLPKDRVNPHFGSRFTGLDTIVERVDPVLAEHGLLWLTHPGIDEQGRPALNYQLTAIDTGESLAGLMPLLLGKADMQGLGSAFTYARRYALVIVLNLVADEDDDGNQASTGDVQFRGDAGQPGTVNLQDAAKGLRNEAINQAFAKAGLPAQEKPWGPLGRIPSDRADALREALTQQRAMA